VKVAAVQPVCAAKEVRANAFEHAAAIRSAQARLVVFPELSLTGYELDAETVSPADEALRPITAACAETRTVALVGAPVAGAAGTSYIAMLRVSAAGVDVVYRKSHLGGDERRRFTPGGGPASIDVDGWRIGLGICKDTGVAEHVAGTAALRVDVYVAGLVHRPDELDLQEQRAVRIARACNAYVAFASFAGPTGGGYESTAGVSTIWAHDGTPLARAGLAAGGAAVAQPSRNRETTRA
jgi:predicted amidohydrolase